MTKACKLALLGAAAAAFALPAAAQMRGTLSAVYAGAGIGQGTIRGVCQPGFTLCDDQDTSVRLFGGYQFSRFLAGELGFARLGKAKTGFPGLSSEVKASAWDLSAIAAWPLGPISVLGRLGVYHGERETTGDALVNEKSTNTDLTYGLGAQYDFNRNLGLRLEWQRYNRMGGGLLGKSDTDNVSLGALWRFQ